jgi:hypothetical protein
MLQGFIGRPSVTRRQPYMASKGLVSRGFQGENAGTKES